MKHALTVAALFVVAVAMILGLRAFAHHAADAVPVTLTLQLHARQTTHITNRQYRRFVIRSEYPVRVAAGSCHADYTVELRCDSGPADMFVEDLRPFLSSFGLNNVEVTGYVF